jgi:hypothetical protein
MLDLVLRPLRVLCQQEPQAVDAGDARGTKLEFGNRALFARWTEAVAARSNAHVEIAGAGVANATVERPCVLGNVVLHSDIHMAEPADRQRQRLAVGA